jgi:geranylgeranyl diphosphate synthase type I
MKLKDYTDSIRALISERIDREIQIFASECKGRGSELGYVFPSLAEYGRSGKMLRGALVCMSSCLFGNSFEPSDAAIDLAAAMELFQSGLLVHDDIMDKDDTRRGRPTMHRLFENLEKTLSESHASRPQATNFAVLGESLGICAGDIYYFIAWKLINKHSTTIGSLVSRELVDVCLAQMRDVRIGALPALPSLEEILDVYAFKTARYTITMPLCCGALLEKHGDAITFIEELGINLGILFQLQDDYLGLFGDTEKLGKPTGSDLREGKKTPFIILLQPKLSAEESARFASIFGNETLTGNDVAFVRQLIIAHGVHTEIKALSESYANKARSALSALAAHIANDSEAATDILSMLGEFIEYSLARTC